MGNVLNRFKGGVAGQKHGRDDSNEDPRMVVAPSAAAPSASAAAARPRKKPRVSYDVVPSSEIDTAIDKLRTKQCCTLEALFQEYPALRKNPVFWRSFLQHQTTLPLFSLQDVFVRYKKEFLQDTDLVADLCAYDGRVYFTLVPYSKHRRERNVVEALLQNYPAAIMEGLSHNTLLRFPDLVAKALQRLPLNLEDVRFILLESNDSLPEELWENRDIVLAWARGGGCWHEEIPLRFKRDSEIMHLLDRPQNRTVHSSEQPELTQVQKADKAFMMDMVKAAHPLLLYHAHDNLVGDVDLVIASLSSPCALALFCGDGTEWLDWCDHRAMYLMNTVAQTVRERLQKREFSSTNQEMLQRARANLALDGFHWTD